MKLIFLGTGPTEPVRRPERRSERTNSSIILVDDEEAILFDCTPNFTEQMHREKLNPEIIRYVFLSHGHMDAVGGLPQLFRANKDFTVYCSNETKDRVLEEFKSLKSARFENIEHGKEVDIHLRGDAHVRVIPFDVTHAEAFPTGKKFPTLGFRIELKS